MMIVIGAIWRKERRQRRAGQIMTRIGNSAVSFTPEFIDMEREREGSFVLSICPYVPVDDMRVAWLLPF